MEGSCELLCGEHDAGAGYHELVAAEEVNTVVPHRWNRCHHIPHKSLRYEVVALQ